MTRRAILIASSPKSDPIPGVYADILAWSAFLRSASGGTWSEQEIQPIKDGTREEVMAAIASARASEYSFVVFAGHGQTVKTDLPWKETQIILAGNDSALERELNPGSPRCAIVLDCCRRDASMEQISFSTKEAALFESTTDPVRSRALYDATLGEAESGVVRVYATAEGAAAADHGSFSQHLVHSAKEWAMHHHGVLLLGDAVTLANSSISRTEPQQTPEYRGGRRLRHFPFAVNP